MTRFRPCIDLHAGEVKQIVGGTLTEREGDLRTNHVSTQSAAYFAELYQKNDLQGAHVVMLGPGNEIAAKEALKAWPGSLQIGGGITDQNAALWIENGASKVIITSFLFPNGQFSQDRLDDVLKALGNDEDKLVIDLSCRRKDSTWFVAMNKWQTITEFEITTENIKLLENYCSEFLVHAADNEGLQQGIDEDLIKKLSEWSRFPVTYAGGANRIEDLQTVADISGGRVDLTIGSALDVFGGSLVKFDDCVAWNKQQA